MPVAPAEAERVVPDLLHLTELQVSTRLETDGSGVALAAGTRAKSAQY
jgi:hypothetical protein